MESCSLVDECLIAAHPCTPGRVLLNALRVYIYTRQKAPSNFKDDAVIHALSASAAYHCQVTPALSIQHFAFAAGAIYCCTCFIEFYAFPLIPFTNHKDSHLCHLH